MKKEKVSEVISQIDDKYIAEAAAFAGGQEASGVRAAQENATGTGSSSGRRNLRFSG